MANTYLVSNSQYRPYTFDEMLKPYAMYTEAYHKMEDELGNLDIMAKDVLSKLTNNPDDVALKAQYESFNKELSAASEDLLANGLNSQSRRKLSGLKALYAKELNPINDAYKAYAEDQKTLATLKRSHPELILEGLGASVASYMNGKIPSGLTANKNDIFTKSKDAAAGLSARLFDPDNPHSVLGGQYFKYIIAGGVTQDAVKELNQYLKNPEYIKSEQGKALYNIVQRERQRVGYDSFSGNAKDEIDASILEGIFAGAKYDKKYNYLTDHSYVKPGTDSGEDPVDPESQNIWARPRARVHVNPDGTKTTKVQKDMDFIKDMVKNPEDIMRKVVIEPKQTVGAGAITMPPSTTSYPNIEKLEQLGKKYGIELDIKTDKKGNKSIANADEVLAELQSVIDKSAQLHQDYILNTIDSDQAMTVLRTNISSYQSDSGKLGLREIDKNGLVEDDTDKKRKIEKNKQWLQDAKDIAIQYRPGTGIVITDGNRTFKLEASVLLNADLADYINTVETLINRPRIKEGPNAETITEYNKRRKDEVAFATNLITGYTQDDGTYVKGLTELLYREFNSSVPVQAKSSSKPQ